MTYKPNSSVALCAALLSIALLGTGCAKQEIAKSRMQYDKQEPCDIHSQAAPPCGNQIFPNGVTTYLKGLKKGENNATATFVVHDPDGTDRTSFSTPRNGHIWFTVGASDNGQYLYAIENLKDAEELVQDLVNTLSATGTKPLPGSDLSLHKIDMLGQNMTTVMTWHGLLLDFYQQKDRMIFEEINSDTKTEKLILADISGKPLKTLFEMQWNDPKDIVVFSKGLISPNGSQAVIKSTLLTPTTRPTYDYVLFDLNSGTKTNLDDMPKDGQLDRDVLGWQDDNNLLLRNFRFATSTYSVNEARLKTTGNQ